MTKNITKKKEALNNKQKAKKMKNDKVKKNNVYNKETIGTMLLLILLFLASSITFFIKAISIIPEKNINYQEKSNLDYRVYLKENSFYDTEYLNKDMVYVASLIDRIDIDFDYLFNINNDSNIDFDYDIIGKLLITNGNGEKVFLEKDYPLLNKVNESMQNNKQHMIRRSISIDYDYYNDLANRFKANYGVDVTSNLIIYLRVNEKSNVNNKFKLDNHSEMVLSIPLSEKVVNITLDYNEVNESSNIVQKAKIVINNYIYIIISLLSMILMIIYIIKLLPSFIKRKSKYDKYINRLLNEYDRLIVETITPPDKSNKIIIVNDFQELLDVRDNLKLPIKYFVVNKHKKCDFYINHNNELYLLTIEDSSLKE